MTIAVDLGRKATKTNKQNMFKDQLSSNYFIPIIGDLVKVVTACLNGIRASIYKPNTERNARNQQLAERMQSRLTYENA